MHEVPPSSETLVQPPHFTEEEISGAEVSGGSVAVIIGGVGIFDGGMRIAERLSTMTMLAGAAEISVGVIGVALGVTAITDGFRRRKKQDNELQLDKSKTIFQAPPTTDS